MEISNEKLNTIIGLVDEYVKIMNVCDDSKINFNDLKTMAEASWSLTHEGKNAWTCGQVEKEEDDIQKVSIVQTKNSDVTTAQ